jgi:very-short-patch-repair endonuclease
VRRKIIPYNPILKSRAKKLRKNMTLPEVLLWKAIKGKQIGGFDFDRQRPIDHFIVDFYCKDLQLAIEVDGGYHFEDEMLKKDAIRQERLEELGVTFLRFTNDEVKRNLAEVVEKIKEYVEENKDDLVGRV